MLGPTEPLTAPRIGQDAVRLGAEEESALAATWRLTYPYNMTGLPAATLPCGFDGDGLPIGLQIAGHPDRNRSRLRADGAPERCRTRRQHHERDDGGAGGR